MTFLELVDSLVGEAVTFPSGKYNSNHFVLFIFYQFYLQYFKISIKISNQTPFSKLNLHINKIGVSQNYLNSVPLIFIMEHKHYSIFET